MATPASATANTKPDTRGGLAPARIFAATEEGERRGELDIPCMFNPFEYTVTKSNSYSEKDKAKASSRLELQNSGPQTLKLSLIFDSRESEERDVSKITEQLWELMKPIDNGETEKPGAPFVVFQWGVFFFVSVITNMTQKFTLFDTDGTPLRAKVDITFTQHKDRDDDYKRQNPTSGGGPAQQTVTITAGDRLETIALNAYGDPNKWRLIADYNKIPNPSKLILGQTLMIPQENR